MFDEFEKEFSLNDPETEGEETGDEIDESEMTDEDEETDFPGTSSDEDEEM